MFVCVFTVANCNLFGLFSTLHSKMQTGSGNDGIIHLAQSVERLCSAVDSL